MCCSRFIVPQLYASVLHRYTGSFLCRNGGNTHQSPGCGASSMRGRAEAFPIPMDVYISPFDPTHTCVCAFSRLGRGHIPASLNAGKVRCSVGECKFRVSRSILSKWYSALQRLNETRITTHLNSDVNLLADLILFASIFIDPQDRANRKLFLCILRTKSILAAEANLIHRYQIWKHVFIPHASRCGTLATQVVLDCIAYISSERIVGLRTETEYNPRMSCAMQVPLIFAARMRIMRKNCR
ncbi:hypothetical protein BJ138DRAFT_409350 [Hygrophoropsis aurantiaca]|uniref:Uncharacterized protein n=1 Tax=Hygrophoropsis aurantiaca TaxID=72124 RepID=A0ACB8A4B8_9AGAM|nr:hypothetical protein BJ138DRAFT_409350 [Hygrophoropsis aurantiaca]